MPAVEMILILLTFVVIKWICNVRGHISVVLFLKGLLSYMNCIP
jgi:hypothetical protein